MKWVGKTAGLVFVMAFCGAGGAVYGGDQAPIPAETAAPAGLYTLDQAHASLLFRVNHLGFSNYTARFTRFEASVHFDPVNPVASWVRAKIDPTSLETDYPDPGFDFNKKLQGPGWLDVARYPEITYASTAIEMTGPRTMRIHGHLSLHGVTKPVALEARFNGGYAGMIPHDPAARIGFSAMGSFQRSEFGMAYGLPPEGSSFGVGDRVDVIIEAEFTGPPLVE
ncbi:YceI family protein [Luteithermobacter gelatinilyticus]|mgnify:CR=1 FL=1|uniref:YceI family protein n=1 Tax=Luteithermobacter gelatinilyticus TaxID=2582913 RepID=UPI001106C76E|nr:YceI family protein [Luteithermobacter gelatinilyticus]|tara:strand:+ start:5690 stop:6361 length:672 start_codon:yes stop_codon:yes gene_type:complete